MTKVFPRNTSPSLQPAGLCLRAYVYVCACTRMYVRVCAHPRTHTHTCV